VILKDAMREIDRMRNESVQLLEEFPGLREGANGVGVELQRAFAEATDIVDVRREPRSA